MDIHPRAAVRERAGRTRGGARLSGALSRAAIACRVTCCVDPSARGGGGLRGKLKPRRESAPSPRLRGEGGGSLHRARSLRIPLTRKRIYRCVATSPRRRGEVK